VLGALIGICLAAREGLSAGSWRRFLRFGGVSLLSGALAGAVALGCAQKLYSALLGVSAGFSLKAFAIGTLCWVGLGIIIGLGETIYKGTESWKGALGGGCGGLIGGLLCETSRAAASTNAQVAGQALLATSLILLGGATGAGIAFVATVLQRAWLEITNGKQAGRCFDITKFVAHQSGKLLAGLIGSNEWRCHIYLAGDRDILPQHAEIGLVDGTPALTLLPEAQKQGGAWINGERIISRTVALRDGDRIRLGVCEMIYRQKRRLA
jgi:hypothetical protein